MCSALSALRLSMSALVTANALTGCGAESDADDAPLARSAAGAAPMTMQGGATEDGADEAWEEGPVEAASGAAPTPIVPSAPPAPTCLASSSPATCEAQRAEAEALTPPPRPDLVLDGEYLRATVIEGVVDASSDMCLFAEGCVTGSGQRRVVRFGTRSGNIGTADLVIGRPDAKNPLWELDACHGHFHFEGYARYDLIDAATDLALPIGAKHGFCLRDQEAWDPALSNGTCKAYDCDYQGMSRGCADVYKADLDCQWVDITDVPAGVYQLRVTINHESGIEELSYTNNTASVSLQITDADVALLP